MRIRSISLILGMLGLSLSLGEVARSENSRWTSEVYVSGQGGYHTYRIPALVVTAQGNLLAFCEGRKDALSDSGDIDLLVKRSTDNGKTWSQPTVVWNDGENTCGNPCPIVDRSTGAIRLLMTWNHGADREQEIIAGTSRDTRKVFLASSSDEGRTWTQPKEITTQVKRAEWTWYATGPGAGIQIERGPHAGRLVAPCDHIEAETKHYYSHVIFSDDGGETWTLGGRPPRPQVNECQVVELSGNLLLLNMRNYDRSKKCRQTAVSHDGGLTWRDQTLEPILIDPLCQASLRAYGWTEDGTRKLTLFSNPASSTSRANLSLRGSLDEGKTWPFCVVLQAGPSAYSDLAVLPDHRIASLFEAGTKHPYERIVFTSLQPGWTAGRNLPGGGESR